MSDKIESILAELHEYFDGRADAEYHTDSTGAQPDEEMQMLGKVEELQALTASGEKEIRRCEKCLSEYKKRSEFFETECDKITESKDRLQSELAAARDEAEKLRKDNEHQRERRNAARNCIQKLTAEAERLRDRFLCFTSHEERQAMVLRKQAEAVDAHVEHVWTLINNSERKGKHSWFEEAILDSFSDLAQRLHQQADELESPNEPKP